MGHILHTLFQRWHVIPKLGVSFVVWDLPWHKICSHLLSTQPSCSQANITAVVMLPGSGWPNIVKTKGAAGDTVWQAWDCQLLQDPDKHHHEVLSPGTCCCSVPGCLTNLLLLICLRLFGGKNVKPVALYLPLLWHITCSQGTVLVLTLCKWRKLDLFGCCSTVLLLTLKYTVPVPQSAANSHHHFFALSIICMSLHVCKGHRLEPVFG